MFIETKSIHINHIYQITWTHMDLKKTTLLASTPKELFFSHIWCMTGKSDQFAFTFPFSPLDNKTPIPLLLYYHVQHRKLSLGKHSWANIDTACFLYHYNKDWLLSWAEKWTKNVQIWWRISKSENIHICVYSFLFWWMT